MLSLSLGSLQCLFLPTCKILPSPLILSVFLYFCVFHIQLLFVIQAVMHKTWQFEVPRAVHITGSIQNSHPYLVYCLLRVCTTRIKYS